MTRIAQYYWVGESLYVVTWQTLVRNWQMRLVPIVVPRRIVAHHITSHFNGITISPHSILLKSTFSFLHNSFFINRTSNWTSKMSNYCNDDQSSLLRAFPNCLSNDVQPKSFRYQKRDHERAEQRFLEMKNQLRDLTKFVKTLTEQVSPAERTSKETLALREENTPNVATLSTLRESGSFCNYEGALPTTAIASPKTFMWCYFETFW